MTHEDYVRRGALIFRIPASNRSKRPCIKPEDVTADLLVRPKSDSTRQPADRLPAFHAPIAP